MNRSHLDQSHLDNELINPDEFEEIAEIYDSIRVLHQKNGVSDPHLDQTLASDFDHKLKEVMEALSQAVNSESLLTCVKRERSLTAKVDLLTMCAEKVFDFLSHSSSIVQRRASEAQPKQLLSGVIIGIFDGLRDAYADLQQSHMEVVTQNQDARV